MEASLDDIKKLTDILQHIDDDTTSSESDDLIIDEVEIKKTYSARNCNANDDIIKGCVDPDLKTALICNMEKRKVLNEIITKIEDHLIKLKHAYKDCRIQIIRDTKTPRQNKAQIRKRLGAPYFKDNGAFPSPSNEDWIQMLGSKQLLLGNVVRNHWTHEDKYNLIKGVYNEICSQRLANIAKEITNLENNKQAKIMKSIKYEKKVLSNTNLISTLVAEWHTVYWKSKKEKEMDEKLKDEQLILKLVAQWPNRIDWLKISAQYLNARHSELACKAMWNCYASPKFTKVAWKANDNKMLAQLCEKYKFQDWDAIALELNSARSAYQCCIHFHTKLCEKFNRDKWTPEENVYLQSVVESCSIGNYISWGKVAHYFKHRTKHQIYRHYHSCFIERVKKGAFNIDEDILLLTLLKIYGKNLLKIKPFFPDRSTVQLRERFKTLNTDTSSSWTAQEDAKVIRFVSQHGQKNWTKLTDEIHRSAGCIRHRYRTIQKFFEFNPGSSVVDIPRRQNGIYRANVRRRHKLVRKVVEFLLKKVEHLTKKDRILNLKYIHAIMRPINKLEKEKEEYNYKIANQKLESHININYLLSEFFKSSYKCVLKNIRFSDDYVEDCADRIEVILDMLGANLVLPSVDQIQNIVSLDETDKLIISYMVNKREEAIQSTSSVADNYIGKCIPPSIESLMGFRGILLHMHILRAHTRGKYEGYSLYVKSGPNMSYTDNKYTYHNAQLNSMLLKYDQNSKDEARRKEQLFFKRLKLIFQWPFVIADTAANPPQILKLAEAEKPEAPKQKQKPGRKSRAVRNYKITLMNEARRKKKQSNLEIKEVTEDQPAKKIKLEQ